MKTINKNNFNNIQNSLDNLKKNRPEVIYIKDSLTPNYMEFLGLQLAYHIRFTDELKYLPIVILSPLDGFLINKLTPFGQILFTKNIFLNTPPKNLPTFDETNYHEEFLNKIKIERPKDISSNHDISNQWAIYRWAKFLNAQSDAIAKNENSIKNMLYFKYLKQKHSINDSDKLMGQNINNYGLKILCIDDEMKNGWADIFKALFGDNVTLCDRLSSLNVNSIKEYDLVLLDLRLQEDDKDKYSDDLTGHKVLEIVKKINKGIQVIVFSASQKSVALEKANKHDILGYIQKENLAENRLEENYNRIKSLIKKANSRKYLKEIFNIQQDILNLEIFNINNQNYKKIKFEINNIFDVLNSNITNRIHIVIITLYKILEILITENKIIAENSYDKTIKLFKKYSLENHNKEISQIGCTRNYLIHPKKPHPKSICHENLVTNPDKENIITWFKMVRDILSKLKN
jgi:CheY-like chemotaxis protein